MAGMTINAACAPPRSPRRLAVALVAAASLTLAACGGDGTASDPGDGTSTAAADDDAGRSADPTMEMTFEISGAVTVEGTITRDLPVTDGVPFPKSCGEYVGSGGRDVLPLPFLFGKDVGEHTIGFTILLEGYTGPGTYTDDEIDSDGGQYLRIDGVGYGRADGGPAPTVTVQDDGAGEMTFEVLSTDTTPEKTISGSVRWTCED